MLLSFTHQGFQPVFYICFYCFLFVFYYKSITTFFSIEAGSKYVDFKVILLPGVRGDVTFDPSLQFHFEAYNNAASSDINW